MSVIETDVAAVQVSDAGATSRVNNYHILGLLGEGAFSRVYECEDGDGQHFVSARSSGFMQEMHRSGRG